MQRAGRLSAREAHRLQKAAAHLRVFWIREVEERMLVGRVGVLKVIGEEVCECEPLPELAIGRLDLREACR
jgi:hypothetical protein